MSNEYSQVGIVGGGLCGLALAYELAKQGISFELIEARQRFGGRISCLDSQAFSDAKFDLGPSWFWPGQNRILNLIKELELEDRVYTQYASGEAIYETQNGEIQRGVTGISMQGSYRLRSGLMSLVDALVYRITKLGFGSCLSLGSPVSHVKQHEAEISVSHGTGELKCQRLVLALPPRVALSNINFSPALSDQRVDELQAVATWMAVHSKVVAEYEFPFWREEGLSGDAISQKGPLAEIHDASAESPSLNSDERLAPALFGFLGVEPHIRSRHSDQLPGLILAQLERLFGKKAAKPSRLSIQDWANDALTASALDQHIPNHHPLNHWPSTAEQDWGSALLWSGSESAADHTNGYLEGALLACEQSLEQLKI